MYVGVRRSAEWFIPHSLLIYLLSTNDSCETFSLNASAGFWICKPKMKRKGRGDNWGSDLSCWGALKSLATPASDRGMYESVGSHPGILASKSSYSTYIKWTNKEMVSSFVPRLNLYGYTFLVWVKCYKEKIICFFADSWWCNFA